MSAATRIAAFAGALVVVFGLAVVVGGAVGPDEREDADRHHTPAGHAAAGHGASGHARNAQRTPPAGLAIADGSYRLALQRTRLEAGAPARLTFRILDRHGRAVTAFEPVHDRELHLIVVGRDLRDYRHLHPTRSPHGTWSATLTLPRAGAYRAFADFKAGGVQRTLGADLVVAGDFAPRALPAASATSAAGRYRVTVAGGRDGALDFTVRRDGVIVRDLEDHLGAKGHLVVLRAGDLAYLHTHPEPRSLRFGVAFPSPGRYRLFLQFRHRGTVRTAAFTRVVRR